MINRFLTTGEMENQQGVREEEEGGMKVRRTRVDIKL